MATHFVLPEAAIDQGFFSTKIAFSTSTGKSGSVINTDQFPSWAVGSSEYATSFRTQAITGEMAHDGATVDVDGQRYFVGKSALRASTSAGGQRTAHENYSRSPQYRALFLGALYYISKHHKVSGSLTINCLCLGLPVVTYFTHKDDLRSMAMGTHEIPSPVDSGQSIKVHIKEVIVISQPQGAALNFGFKNGKRLDQDRIVVLDMGGGTFDWFFLDRLTPNFIRSGATQLGVLSCVNAICDSLDPKYKSAPLVIERINDALIEGSATVRVDGYELKMDALWPAAKHILDAALAEMAKNVGNLVEVDSFLFTGGGASLLHIASKLANSSLCSQQRKFVLDETPVYSNVCGFYRVAELSNQDS